MSRVKEWEDMGVGTQQGGRYGERDFKEVCLKLTAAPEGARYRVRILGKAISYMAHYAEKKNPKTNERQKAAFPDAEESNRFTRVCTDEEAASENRQTHCPWCRLGYIARPRFLLNVVDYADTDDDGDPKIKFIEIPKIAAQELAEWYRSNKEDYPGGPGDMEGEALDFVFTVVGKPRGEGGTTKYSVTATGKPKMLSQGIISAIKKLNPNAQTPEQTMALYDLEKLCQPTYMPSKHQRDKFNGELIDKLPRNDPEAQDESEEKPRAKPQPADDDDAPAVKPAPAVDDDDEDIDKIFGTTVHKSPVLADEADKEDVKKPVDDDGLDIESAKSEVKW